MAEITIFTSPTCTFCKQAKAYMDDHNMQYTERDITKDSEARKELMEKGYRGVPIIRVDGQDIVGFDVAKLNQLAGK